MKNHNHLFLPRASYKRNLLTASRKARSRVLMMNDRRGFLIPIIAILVLGIILSILGLVFWGKVMDSFESRLGAKWMIWIVVAFFVVIFREPLILIAKMVIKKVGA